MKKKEIITFIIVFSIILSSCGMHDNTKAHNIVLNDESVSDKTADDLSKEMSDALIDTYEIEEQVCGDKSTTRQTFVKTAENWSNSEVIKIIFSGIRETDIDSGTYISEMDGNQVSYWDEDMVIGSPISLLYGETKNPLLSFFYDENMFNDQMIADMVILHLIKDTSFWDVVPDGVIDYERKCVTVPVIESGDYVLVDAIKWFDIWDEDASSYIYIQGDSDSIFKNYKYNEQEKSMIVFDDNGIPYWRNRLTVTLNNTAKKEDLEIIVKDMGVEIISGMNDVCQYTLEFTKDKDYLELKAIVEILEKHSIIKHVDLYYL